MAYIKDKIRERIAEMEKELHRKPKVAVIAVAQVSGAVLETHEDGLIYEWVNREQVALNPETKEASVITLPLWDRARRAFYLFGSREMILIEEPKCEIVTAPKRLVIPG